MHSSYEHLDSNISREHKFFASLQLQFDRCLFRELIYGMFADRFSIGEIRNWEVV